MHMRMVGMVLLLGGLCWFSAGTAALYAQEAAESGVYNNDDDYNDDDYEEDEDDDDGVAVAPHWSNYVGEPYSKGDQTFTISAGVNFPTTYYYSGMRRVERHNWSAVGGTGTLAYTRFLNAHLFVGLEAGVSFNFTLGKNTIFIIPVGIRAGWQFVFRRFEFPLTFVIGVAPERYVNSSYVGLFTKLGGSAFFRFSPEWSFGMNFDWHWYPQWPRQKSATSSVYANILALTIAARYHF